LTKPISEKNDIMLCYASINEEIFDILHNTHSSIGYGGKNRMVAGVKKTSIAIL